MIDIFVTPQQLEDKAKSSEFWKLVDDPNLKSLIIVLILNELRKYPVEQLTGESSRSILAKLKSYQELIDYSDSLISKTKKEEFSSDNPFDKLEAESQKKDQEQKKES